MFTIVDVIVEANPNSLALLQQRVTALALKEDPPGPDTPSFLRLKQIDQLHFLSLEIFQDQHFDPLLVFENNFDGDSESYWRKVLEQIGDDLRAIFACTKPAAEERWAPLFKDGSTLSLEPFIKQYSITPSASHIGAVGMTLQRINRDRNVFSTVQTELGSAALPYRGLTSVELHGKLRTQVLQRHPDLASGEVRSVEQERSSYSRAAWWRVLPFIIAAFISVVALGLLALSEYLPHHGYPWARSVLRWLLALVLFGAAAFWATLRRLEDSDLTQDDPDLEPEELKKFAAQEDHIVQNHVASTVLVKAGVVRSIVIRASLRLLKQFVPAVCADGYLGEMRTIHFAHWTLVGNGGRLLFLSNFDGSWQSYLDDFVDKAHRGLTLAWGNCIGFPRTRNLLYEGATHGREFKVWARRSQTQSLFWYSGYSDLTVNQILRNASIVDGICKSSMTESEAEEWAKLL